MSGSEEDSELEMLRRRKLIEMRRLLEAKRKEVEKPQERPNPREVLSRHFVGRAWEVMRAARLQHPQVAEYVERALAKMIMDGKIKGKITGEELYGLFYRLGFKVRLQTRIRILEDGKAKSLHEKIRESLS
ncbi:MAG: hypothetical protein AYL32_003670 [Candidatus Bathyarchaeota archaeon B26-2]|nr:MAG: hypothetical protein AYL32_003670 [Candidatus Bathyarchaeota archaeon B26-2]